MDLREGFRKMNLKSWSALGSLIILMVFMPLPVVAAEDPQDDDPQESSTVPDAEASDEQGFDEEITVTGTRVQGRSALDTPAPVDYIDGEAIRSTGATETGKVLQMLAPSFNFSSTTISDGTDIIRPATLRALGPDQVLVLVNGKRRHQQALLNVQQTIARGSAGYDINTIPVSAIDHIEVLRDGAAAQYGSDAIAGVINIILKDQTAGTDITVDFGQHYAGDGEVMMAGVNTGFEIGGEGFLNLSFEYRDRGETNRAGVADTNLLGWYNQAEFDAGLREVKLRIGDADSQNISFMFNAEVPTANNGRFYTFGGWSKREGDSSGFFRGPADGRNVPSLYPNGFLPNIITEPTDTSVALGYRDILNDNWTWDISFNYGNNEFKFRERNTVNVSYFFEPLDPNDPLGARFEDSATSADTGTLKFDQLTFNLDFTGIVDWGVGSGPLFMAVGAEWREDTFAIEAGDPISYQYGRTDDRSIQIFNQNGSIAQPGTQGFPGWSPREAVDDGRDNTSLYLDFESQLSDRFLGTLAIRYEDYSDFGSTVNGKLSGRINFNESFSLRGTVSTGFRAPGVQQAFYSQRSTNLNAAGILTDTLTARQNSDVTRAFGVPALKEETSVNYSLGLVGKKDRFRITVDLYRIDIDDRIIFSSNIQPEDVSSCGSPFDPNRCPIRAILDPFGVGQVLFFTNAIDTETEGLDVVMSYDMPLAGGADLLFEGAFHFNDTQVTNRRSSSSILPAEVLFDDPQVTLVEQGQPGEHFLLSGTYSRNSWSANLRFNYYGEVAGQGFTPGFIQTWGGKWLTDLSVKIPLRDNLSFTLGGLNIFDEFPDEWDAANAFPFPQLGFTYGWETLPFGINGGYYFARLNFRINHK